MCSGLRRFAGCWAWDRSACGLILAGLAAATEIMGLAISPVAELGALVAIVGGGAVIESRAFRRMTMSLRSSIS
jgi:hypothetical protein